MESEALGCKKDPRILKIQWKWVRKHGIYEFEVLRFWSAPKIKYLLQLRSVSFCCPIVPVVLEAATDGERLDPSRTWWIPAFHEIALGEVSGMSMSGNKKVVVLCHGSFSMHLQGNTTAGCMALQEGQDVLFFWRHGLGDKFCRPGGPGSTRQIGNEALQSFTWTSHEYLVSYIVKSIDIESHPAAGKPGFCPRIPNLIAWTFLANKNAWGEDLGYKLVRHINQCLIPLLCKVVCFATQQFLGSKIAEVETWGFRRQNLHRRLISPV